MATIEVEVDLGEFDDEEIITELKLRGYKVIDESKEFTGEIIKTDVNGCKIIANEKTYEFSGLMTVVVYDK